MAQACGYNTDHTCENYGYEINTLSKYTHIYLLDGKTSIDNTKTSILQSYQITMIPHLFVSSKMS